MVATIAEILPHAARKHGDKTALIVENRRFSFREFDALSNRVANGLTASGMKPGDRVIVIFPVVERRHDASGLERYRS